MNQVPELPRIKAELKPSPSFAPVTKSFTTGVLLACIIGGCYLYEGSGVLIPPQHGDILTQTQIQERLLAFNALKPVPLEIVQEKDVNDALNSMGLSADAKQSLQAKMINPTIQPVSITGNPLKLAWITLWDTDVQDGDVVRIDSQGYSRTVVLTKAPVTFAIPIPADGRVNITGIKDGDGGGITVGLASGTAKAVFPVMSEGQVLGLRVGVQ